MRDEEGAELSEEAGGSQRPARWTQAYAIAVSLLLLGLWVGLILWIMFRPAFVASLEWTERVAGWGIALGLLSGVALLSMFAIASLYNAQQGSPNTSHKQSIAWAIAGLAFIVAINVMAFRTLLFEALPYVLSSGETRPGIERTTVASHVMQKLGNGFRLKSENGYERLVPSGNSRAIFCAERGWTVEMSGDVGRWGMHLKRVAIRKRYTDTGFDIDYEGNSVQFFGEC